MIWGRSKASCVLSADIVILVWFLSRLYTVGLPGYQPFSLTTLAGDIAAGPTVEATRALSAQDREIVNAYEQPSDSAEPGNELPAEASVQDTVQMNPDGSVIGGDSTGPDTEMIAYPPPPEEALEGGADSNQPLVEAEPGSEPPVEATVQDPVQMNEDGSVIGADEAGTDTEIVAPPPPPDGAVDGGVDSNQPLAEAEPGSEPPQVDPVQDPVQMNQDGSVIGADATGTDTEIIAPSPPPEDQASAPSQPPADGEPGPDSPPEEPPLDPLPGSEPDTVGPIITDDLGIPPEAEIPPPQ
jgi:hypothetical protein